MMKYKYPIIAALAMFPLLTSQIREAVSYNVNTSKVIETEILPNMNNLDRDGLRKVIVILNNVIKANTQVLTSTIKIIESEGNEK